MLKCLCSKPCLPVDDGKKLKSTHPPAWGLPFSEIFARWMAFFTLFPCPHPKLWSTKELGIQTPIRWLFWDISLPSSWSAGFPNKVVLLASRPCLLHLLACCAGSRTSLDLITCLPVPSKANLVTSDSGERKCSAYHKAPIQGERVVHAPKPLNSWRVSAKHFQRQGERGTPGYVIS